MIKNSILIIMTLSAIFSIIAITENPSKVYAEKDSKKELCKENGGEWEDVVCDFKTDYEDELCDDAKDTKKYPKICKDNSN